MPDIASIMRERAYFIWEQEGRPQGRAEAHWAAAAEQVQQMMSASVEPHAKSGAAAESETGVEPAGEKKSSIAAVVLN